MVKDGTKITSDITVYGATGFVGKYILDYLLQSASVNSQPIRLVLAGRNEAKLVQRLKSLVVRGGSTASICVADSSDLDALKSMASNTKVVMSCAGPFALFGTHIVEACATVGTDYVDITGEFQWAAQMRQSFGDAAKKSGARIISLAGFDSIPSDLSIFAAVHALREVRGRLVEIDKGVTWHHMVGAANGGTIHTATNMPVDVKKMISDGSKWRKVPYLMEDPLCLTHPTKVRFNPEYEERKNKMAMTEWFNVFPSFDSVLAGGMSLMFFMAPVNSKVVNASAVSLNYGSDFKYFERWVFLGFRTTRALGFWSAIPSMLLQIWIFFGILLLKLPYLSQKFLDYFYPPGSGAPDAFNRRCTCEVYAEVTSKAEAPSNNGSVDRAACHITFQGDPGNLVTAQVVSEVALALLYNRADLPPNSEDGFGTPCELVGKVLMKRLMESKVRKVNIETAVHKDMLRNNLQLLV
jgi:short subunit dehydrogenase-like uncharacterized protein